MNPAQHVSAEGRQGVRHPIEILWIWFAVALAWLAVARVRGAKLQSSRGSTCRWTTYTTAWSWAGCTAPRCPQEMFLKRNLSPAMIWVMLGLLLATMLIGIPILLCIAMNGFVGIAAEPAW